MTCTLPRLHRVPTHVLFPILMVVISLSVFPHDCNAQSTKSGRNPAHANTLSESLASAPKLLRSYTTDPVSIKIVLPELSNKAALSMSKTGVTKWPPQIGLNRFLPSDYQGNLSGLLATDWVQLDDSSMVSTISISSKGASALRVAFTANIKTGAEIRFFNSRILVNGVQGRSRDQFPIVMEQYANEDFSEEDENGERIPQWSPIIEGDSIGLEIKIPKTALSNFTFELLSISHIFVPLRKAINNSAIRKCGTNINVMCRVDTIPSGKGLETTVAKIVISSQKGSFLCTGSLLMDTVESFAPYFLTARHCVSNRSEARSVEFRWMFQSERCNIWKRDPRFMVTTGGGELLRTRIQEDSTLIKLKNAPPSEAWFAGWTADRVKEGEWVFGIHHPGGMLKNYSLGLLKRYQRTGVCEEVDRRIGCFTLPNALKIPWGDGFSAGGSSGSPLFLKSEPEYVIGVLSGGPDDNCSASYGPFYQFFTHVKYWLWPNEPVRSGSPPNCGGDRPIGDRCP